MISFIVIGRNEGWKLTKCLQSVFDTIKYNQLNDYEIIYVDSTSTDDSIERAKSFDKIKIFQITGKCNAAIGRNIGVKESNGEVLFFIDGDMEIMPEFLKLVYNEQNILLYDFVSGQLKNFNYSLKGDFENNSLQYKNVLNEDKTSSTTGGIFLLKRDLWDLVDGMNADFKRGQDLDFSLKLALKGYKILRKKEVIANHHTIQYHHKERIWKTLFSGDILYSKSLLYRKHFFNKYMYGKIIRTEYSLIILLFLLLLSTGLQNCYLLLPYFFVIIYRAFKSRIDLFSKLQLFLYFPIRDILILLGIIFFHPSDNKKRHYKEII